MAEEQNRTSSQGHLSVDQLQQELNAKDLLLEALRYENNSLREHSDRHYDPAPAQDWKSYDVLKKKVAEYQSALEQRDQFIGQMEAGIKQLMQKNMESEAKGRKAEEYYSGEIRTLAQQVQKLTAQLSLTSNQHQAAMRATQEHFTQQLAASKQQMREKHECELATLREQHVLEMEGVTTQMEALEKSKTEEYAKLMERLTRHNSTLGSLFEEEKERVASLLRDREEWEVYKKELEAEVEEKENLRRRLDEQLASKEDLQERLRKQIERQITNEEKINSLQKVCEGLSQDLKLERERRKEIEDKAEEEVHNTRRLFEQKTAAEVKQEQLTLQLLAAEEELAKMSASKESDCRELESLRQTKETLTQENMALSRDKERLTQERNTLTSEKEMLDKEKEDLLRDKQLLTKENTSLALKSESLTKNIEELTSHCEATAKEKERLESDYRKLHKDKEAITLQHTTVLEGSKLKEKEKEYLLKEFEILTKTKESLVLERDTLLSEKKDSAREKDLWSRESEAWLTEKETLLTERDNLILGNKNLMSEKIMLAEEKKSLSVKVESLSSEKENLEKTNEELSVQISSLTSERAVLVKERNDLDTEKHSWMEEKKALLQETDIWATEKETLLSERDALLSEKLSLTADKEMWDKEKQSLSQQHETLCKEKEDWILKEESLNKENASLATRNEALAKENNSVANEKLLLMQQNECLCQENKRLSEEKEALVTQVKNLGTEQERLLEQLGGFTSKVEGLVADKDYLADRINILQREKEALTQRGLQARKDAAEGQVESLEEEVKGGRVVRQHLEQSAVVEAEGKNFENKYTQTLELEESDLRELGESYKKKYSVKELELKQLEENFKRKVSQKERELGEMYRVISLEKDNELKELRERIAVKENELQKLSKKVRGIEELHENCLTLLEHLQSGEEQRKRMEEDCEDKCEMLNSVLRSVDVKLCEAASLLSQQQPGAAEAVQGAASRRNSTEKRGREKGDVERRRLKGELDSMKRKLEERGRSEGSLREKLTLLEKEKKELCNEAERMESKIHEQHFVITSLQNEKMRLGQHITCLEEERSSWKAVEVSNSKDNLNTQEELTSLRVKVRHQEEMLELQEKEIQKLHQTLTELIQEDADCPEKLRDVLRGLLSSPKLGRPESSSEDVDESVWLSTLCQELEVHWKHQHSYLECLNELQQHSDKLQQEKLQAELENISLHAELDCLRQQQARVDAGVEEGVGTATEGSDVKAAELGRLKQENKLLQECLASNNFLLRHEKFQKLCPKPKFERELKLRLLERRAVMQVVGTWLERCVAQWKQQAESHPPLARFIEAFTSYVEDLSDHLLGTHSGNSTMNIEAAVSCLQQAVVKVVSGEYQEAVSTTLKSLEQDLIRILHHISLPSELGAAQQHAPPQQDTPQQQHTRSTSPLHGEHPALQKDASSEDPHSFVQDLTARVEQLINVRTALVDAANELDEELEDTIGQRVAVLREQLRAMLCSREPGTEVRPCLPVLPDHKTFIQEFTDFTTEVSQEAHAEKVQVLRSQQEMVHKILEDNQAKLRKVCQDFLGTVQELTSLGEVEARVQALVDSLESTLAKEVVWVEQQYKDLLEQYIQEQDVNHQACARTCSHLIDTLTHLLQSAEFEDDAEELGEDNSSEAVQLQQTHMEKIHHLEAQLAAKDQEALQHLQGVYSDRDWYKKTVGLLSHVTLQLLHYYSVAQSLTRQPQQDSCAPPSHPADFPSPGKAVDLSFRSDCAAEEGEMLGFSEDGVLATGLVGRTAFGAEGEAEEAESALDCTAVSEGMLEDFDKDEQVRNLLERSYPQLMAILKGRCDVVQVACLEKEIQELVISLQASAGMLKIFIHSVSSDKSDLSSHTLKGDTEGDSVQDSALETSPSQPSRGNSDVRDGSLTTPDPLSPMQQSAQDVVRPPRSVLQQDLSSISEGLIQLLSQDETLASFTMLTHQDPQNKEHLKAILAQLCEAAQATANLKLELHHARGLQQGLEEERLTLQEEVARLTHYNKNLARELQVLKDRLEETEGQENQKPVSKYAAKWETRKDIRERASAALTAKNTLQLGQQQLEARVRELEALLEEVVKESDTALEELRARETDLMQQLEVADRQLKSARQFLEEHASERDQEVEELVAARDKLSMQLREQETQIALQGSKDKEICDLREIIHSLESQADCRGMREAELTKQVETLGEALTQTQQEVQRLSSKVEELQHGGGRQVREPQTDEAEAGQGVPGQDEERGRALRRSTSLLAEMQEDSLNTSAMFQRIEKRLGDTTRGLEALQLSGSVEDISAQEVEVTIVGAEGRISPATVDRRLEDQLLALEHTTEAAIKRNKDLQLTIKNLQRENEEVSAERDTLQERSKEQLVKISSLEARLDEIRRADHPAVADFRQRLALVQEDLEVKRAELTKKGREVEELKHTLFNLRTQLTTREGELQHLQSVSTSQPSSLQEAPQDKHATSGAPLEENLAKKTQINETCKNEHADVDQKSFLSPLAVDLIKEKNAEISELTNKLKLLVGAVQSVMALLKEGGSPAKAQHMLSCALSSEGGEALDESEEQEMLREAEAEQVPIAGSVSTHNVEEAAATETSPEMLRLSRGPAEGSVHTQASARDVSLMSTHTVPTSEPSQTHLEEDFRSAQELLEAREAEILQLSEEVEDSPPMPLATSLHSSDLQLKVEQLQQALHEVQVSKTDSEAQLEQLSLQNKLCNDELKQLQCTWATLKQEAQLHVEQLKEKEALLRALRQQLEDSTQQHGKQQEELSSRLRASKEQVIQLSSALQGKSDEVQQLLAQLEQVHADLRERLAQASREAAHMEEQCQQKISDLKEEHVAREKELSSYYEEHMARQIRDIAERMTKDKEAAIARQQEVFEATLHQAMQEKDQADGELEQHLTATPPALHSHAPEQQTASQLCASVNALATGLRNELEKSGQLDQSMTSLMRAGGSGEAGTSTRASSALSDASEGEEPAAITGRIQHLMNKIHNEGIEVLTQIDVLFLCKHHTKLDSSQRSLLTGSGLVSSLLVDGGEVGGEQSSLLRKLAAVEEELAKKEQEMKQRTGVLEFQLEQEKLCGNEWKLSYESEKKHTRDLMEHLRKERLSGAEHVSELARLRSHIFILRLQHQTVQEENCSLSENQKEKDKQIENLQSALQAERNNFSRVSKVLNEERKVFGLTHAQQEDIIKDLRNILEKEREKIMSLSNHLERVVRQQHSQPLTTTTTATAKHSSTLKSSTSEELKTQLAVERERCMKLERAYEREKLQAMTQKEQAVAERARARAEIRETECKLSELTRAVRSLETEKERLVRQMSHERDLQQHQESRIRELEGEVKRLEADSKAQSEGHQAMAEKMREEGAQLHLAYTRTLTRLGEVEAEVCELQHKLRGAAHELQLARDREEQLKQDLHTERTAIDQLGLSALSNFDECAEAQLKQNLELCKSVLKLTDDQQAMRTQIAGLKDTISSLTQQLLSAQAASGKAEEALKTERLAWERERTSLQNWQNQRESEAERMRTERTTQQRTPSAAEVTQLYGRYLQSEHQRKALVWQKRYLLVVIKGYSDTEQHTRTRLTAMVPLHLFPSTSTHHQARQSRGKFRVMGLVVVALCRMRKLVQRFQMKLHHWEMSSLTAPSAASTPDSSRPQSSNSVAAGRDMWRASHSTYTEGMHSSFTGLTPPTRGPANSTPHRPLSASRRSLFQEDSSQLNQYVERLDTIHSVLGLSRRQQ